MNLRTYLMLLLMMMGFNNRLTAQDILAPDPREMAEKSTQKLAQSLKLSDDQRVKVLQILILHNGEIAKALKENQSNPSAMQGVAAKLGKETDVRLNAVLGPAQRVVFDKIKAGRISAMKKRMQGNSKLLQ